MVFKSFKKLLSDLLNKTSRIIWVLGKRAFLTILTITLLNILFGVLLYYNYVVVGSIQKDDPGNSAVVSFEEDAYQMVLKEQQIRNEIFETPFAESSYENPFSAD